MLLICEMCGEANNSIMKMPCGYYIDYSDGQAILTLPNDEEAYRNICLACITGEKEIRTT